jgi:hypothetical protein
MQKQRSSLPLVLGLIALAAVGRYLPYIVPGLGNFTPVFAVALFGGAYLADKRVALLVPMLAMLVTDVFIGFHNLMWLVYGCMALCAYLGMRMQNRVSAGGVLGSALAGSLLFFIASNVAVWLSASMYPMTPQGLAECFFMALPFWRNELLGSLGWSLLLFGSYALASAPRAKPAAV